MGVFVVVLIGIGSVCCCWQQFERLLLLILEGVVINNPQTISNVPNVNNIEKTLQYNQQYMLPRQQYQIPIPCVSQ